MNQFLSELMSMRTARLAATAVLILLALFLLVLTWDKAFGRDVADPYASITVEGTGSVAMIPDTARITFTVMESSAAVADAQAAATEKTDAALAALDDMDIDERDVKTLSYNVSPQYAYPQPCYGGICQPSSPRITGYQVSQTVEVKVRDTAKAGDVLAALGGLGVQNVSGPEFVVDDESAIKDEARAEAVAEARENAKQLAKELGVRLGDVISYNEMGPEYYGYGGMRDMAVSAVAPQSAPSLPAGENETEVTVMVTYEIR